MSEPGASGHWAHTRERGSAFWLKFMLATFRLLGRRMVLLFLYPAVTYFFLFVPRARRASLAYLHRLAATPEGRRALGRTPTLRDAFRTILEFGRASIDKYASWSGTITRMDTAWVGVEAILEQVRSGRGGVILGAHLGNLEVLRALAITRPIFKVNALMLIHHAERYNQILRSAHPDVFSQVILTDTIGPETAILLREKIEAGEFVAILADRVADGAADRVVSVPFFGEPAPFPQGPFILASLLKAPVFTLFCLRRGPREYHVHIEPFAHPALVLPRETREASLRDAAARFASVLERHCCKAPHQWFNFYDFWKPPAR